MPEYAELHATAEQISDAARGQRFVKAQVNTAWSLPQSLPKTPDGKEVPGDTTITLPGTAAWLDGFEMTARHRGKEVCIALRPLAIPHVATKGGTSRSQLEPRAEAALRMAQQPSVSSGASMRHQKTNCSHIVQPVTRLM